MKVSTSAQIIYYCSISPGSIPGIIIYIFTIGRSLWSGVGIEILTNVRWVVLFFILKQVISSVGAPFSGEMTEWR